MSDSNTISMPGRLCRIYKGNLKDELYLYVDMKEDLESVPQELLDSMGKLSEVMTLRITEDKKLARVDAGTVLEEIRDKGYFVQMPPAPYPEAVTGGQ